MRYRERSDIIADILRSASGQGQRKTGILHGANLSHTQLTQYLKFLIDEGFLEYDPQKETYTTSTKGHEFLRLYSRLEAFKKDQNGWLGRTGGREQDG